MRAVSVVVIHELREDRDEVTSSKDDHAVQALSADRSYEALGDGVGLRRSDRVRITCTPADRKTSSKLAVNFVSRSQTSQVAGILHSPMVDAS
jgi:hypothetical protein